MIDREEFIRYWIRHDPNITEWKGFLFISVYITGMILFVIPFKFFDPEDHLIITIMWFPLFFGYLILFPLLWEHVFVGKRDKRFLKCPRCGRSCRIKDNRMIMVATGRCGFCGEEVFTKNPE